MMEVQDLILDSLLKLISENTTLKNLQKSRQIMSKFFKMSTNIIGLFLLEIEMYESLVK